MSASEVSKLNGLEMKGSTLIVELARKKDQKPDNSNSFNKTPSRDDGGGGYNFSIHT